MAAAAGATHVGLVSAMPSGPGPIEDVRIAELAAGAPDTVTTVLLTARTDPAAIVAHVLETEVDAVQIVHPVPPGVRHSVRQALPGIGVWQVVHVGGPESGREALEAAKGSDGLLLDSGRPGAVVPELGGTGRTHDWHASAEIVRRTSIPVLLAGGLRPDNVAEAIETVRPSGVDVCSGLRTRDAVLDPDRLRGFVRAVRTT